MKNQHRKGIIGGMFGLTDFGDKPKNPPLFFSEECVWLVNARSCILLLIESLAPDRIWLPSYLCGDILKGIKDPTKIKYYEIQSDLKINPHSWVDDLSAGDLVLVINYFGFKADQEVLQAIKRKQAWILEDACQALLTTGLGQYADFVILSPRKFVGIPDGGILVNFTNQFFQVDSLSNPPGEWWLQALQASISRRIFDRCGGNRDWFQVFQEVENKSPVGNYQMSDLSRSILYHLVDYNEIAEIRRRNYLFLLDSIGEFALFPQLPSDVVPLGFPVRLSNREQVKDIFYKMDIYPPIHWNIKDMVPKQYQESHLLSSQILTLICDQRYDLDHMQQIVDVIKTYAE